MLCKNVTVRKSPFQAVSGCDQQRLFLMVPIPFHIMAISFPF